MPSKHKHKRIYSAEQDAILRTGYHDGVSAEVLLGWMNDNNPAGERPWLHRTLIGRIRALALLRPDWYRQEVARHAVPSPTAARERGNARRVSVNDSRRKPPPIEWTLCGTRDGGVSPALMEALIEVGRYATAWCDRETAAAWGRRWAGSCDLAQINAKRMEYELPVFELRDR